MTTVAIGDIHGMYDMLDRLLTEIDAFSLRERWIERPKLVFLGDYVDRGPDSRRVVRRLRALQSEFAVCLRGNHEDMMWRCEERSIDWQNFISNGGMRNLSRMLFLRRPDAYCPAPASCYVKCIIAEIVVAALPASLIWRYGERSTHSKYVFSPMCRFSFWPKSYACPIFPRWHQCCPDWPESRGSGHFL